MSTTARMGARLFALNLASMRNLIESSKVVAMALPSIIFAVIG